MPLAVARIGDSFTDSDRVQQGSGDVFTNNIPTARLGDLTTGHLCPPSGLWPPVPINSGSGSVFVNNRPLARLTDTHDVHCCGDSCHIANINTGSGDVFSG